jgi:hypothetical protein
VPNASSIVFDIDIKNEYRFMTIASRKSSTIR